MAYGCCGYLCVIFYFKQKTAYELRISDWSSDLCSSDLRGGGQADRDHALHRAGLRAGDRQRLLELAQHETGVMIERETVFRRRDALGRAVQQRLADLVLQLRELLAERRLRDVELAGGLRQAPALRSEEHTSELQSLMRRSYAVFCLKKKKQQTH